MTQTYCLRCKRATADVNPHKASTRNGQVRLASTCQQCGGGKSSMLPKYASVPGVNRGKKRKRGGFIGDILGSIF